MTMTDDKRIETEVTPGEGKKMVTAIVRRALDNLPWSRAEKLVTTRRVTVNGVIVDAVGQRVRVRDVVVISPEAMKVTRGMLEPERVVHVDEHVIVVRKPAGMLTVPFDEEDRDTLVDRVRVWARKHDGNEELGWVQRLDKDTTGLVVFVRSFAAKKALTDQFAAHTIERRYQALVHGAARTATYDTMLVKNRGDGIRGTFGSWRRGPKLKPGAKPGADAQQAVTHVRVLETWSNASLVECQLETGRTHQIRIHLAEAGTPIVGEPVYIRDFPIAQIKAERPMLHAWILGFVHPRGHALRFEDPPPDDFLAMAARLRTR